MNTIAETDLWLPGDVLGGAVLDGWTGPIQHGPHDPSLSFLEACDDTSPPRVRCTRPEVRDRLRRVLAAGERCVMDHHCIPGNGCPDCNGTGYTRPPHDLAWLTDAELSGRVTPLEAAALWWCSALLVEAGLGPVSRLHPWRPGGGRGWRWGERADHRGTTIAACCVHPMGDRSEGWWMDSAGLSASGLAVGDEGRAAADAAALAAGYALHDGDHLLLPHPDGPVRLDLSITETP